MKILQLKLPVVCFVLVTIVPVSLAEDVTFGKTRYSSPKERKEADVNFTVSDSKLVVNGKKKSALHVEIPFSSIDAVSYESATRHRTGEGVALLSTSPLAGAILMSKKTKSHWLDIEYHDGKAKQLLILRLDKSEYEKVISTLESRTGKKIATLDAKSSPFNPTAESKDMDEVIPFRLEAVQAAIKPAMENMGCKVTELKANRAECKRRRSKDSDVERTGGGGEKVTATMELQGEQTHVRIWTGKGFSGRMVKRNWSTAIYKEMLKNLEKSGKTESASNPT